MRRYKEFVLFFFFLLILNCNSDRFFDPTLFHSEFKGITYTNWEYIYEHEAVGFDPYVPGYYPLEDKSDWGSDSVWPYTDIMESSVFYVEISRDTTELISYSIYPRIYSISDVEPNPVYRYSSGVEFHFSIPMDVYVFIAIIDKNYEIVRTLNSGVLPNGYYSIIWDLTNKMGVKVYSDVYRCIYKMGDFQGHGDIWVMNSE